MGEGKGRGSRRGMQTGTEPETRPSLPPSPGGLAETGKLGLGGGGGRIIECT